MAGGIQLSVKLPPRLPILTKAAYGDGIANWWQQSVSATERLLHFDFLFRVRTLPTTLWV